MCRAQAPGRPTAIGEGEDMCRSRSKGRTATKTLAARSFDCGVTACKESTNILFAGDNNWGKTRKGARNAMAEWAFVNPARIWLGCSDPSGIDLFIGHTSGPKGPQSNLTHYEYVTQPTIEFEVMVTDDRVSLDKWAKIWAHAQENGLGSLRSQDFGRFDIELWEQVREGQSRAAAKNGRARELVPA